MKLNAVLCVIILTVLLPWGPAFAKTPDGTNPGDETTCDALKDATPGLYGLCVAFCEAQGCDPDFGLDDPYAACTNSYQNLLDAYDNKRGTNDPEMPCLAGTGTLFAGTGSSMDGTAAVLQYIERTGLFIDISGGGLGDMVFDITRHDGDLYAAVYDRHCGTSTVTSCWLDCYRKEHCTTDENHIYDCAMVYRRRAGSTTWEAVGGDISGYTWWDTACFCDGICEEFESTFEPEESRSVYITDLEEYGGVLYAVTQDNFNGGRLLRLEADRWILVADLNRVSNGLITLREFRGDLYIGDLEGGRVLRYGGGTIGPEAVLHNGNRSTWDLEEYDGILYASDSAGNILFSADGAVWEQWSAVPCADVWEMHVHGDALYLGCDGDRSDPEGLFVELWHFDGLVLRGPVWQTSGHSGVISMTEHGGRLVFGTGEYYPRYDAGIPVKGLIYSYDAGTGEVREMSGPYGGGVQVLYSDSP